MTRTKTFAAVIVAAALAAAAPAPAVAAPAIPYEQAPSSIKWDSYPLASTDDGTEFRLYAWAIFATPTIDGLFDDNAGLLTAKGRAAIEHKGFKRFRLVAEFGTSPRSPKIAAAMREARRYRWNVLLAVRVDGKAAPKAAAYSRWLRSMLHVYPLIRAVEPANEPEWNNVTVNQAVKFYRAAKRTAGAKRDVLAGSFSDAPQAGWPFAEYAAKVHADLYALHAYTTVWRNQLGRLRQSIKALGATRVWITETAAMTEYDDQTFTPAEQSQQAARIVRLSKWTEVEHTYTTGWQSCNGCQPDLLP